ncbi:phage tail protein [Campylobacter curvus]|uniref:phage tail protein n=1 Tax=Campylobacter curvus TaxID=200 RepID=UPI00146FD09E|nr:phage tail protein [Campylobacter curvus]
MANLKEENKWEEGIYQLEVTDPVVGGIDGISNKQAKQLANRTKFLKEQVEAATDNANSRVLTSTYDAEKVDFATKSEVNAKLDKTDAAADSNKLGGKAPSEYASANHNHDGIYLKKDEASDGTPIGAYLAWSSQEKIPAGYLLCDGRSLKKSEYAELFAVIGYTYGGSGENFNIPKFNDGRFMRGTGGNAAALGALQSDEIKEHSHYVWYGNNETELVAEGSNSFGKNPRNDNNTRFRFSTTNTGGIETRPQNSAVVFIIKAKNVREAKQSEIDKTPYATETKAGIIKIKNSITGQQEDVAVSEKAVASIASIGINQTWQDMTSQRQPNVTYTNTTGRSIFVLVRDASASANGRNYDFYVDGINICPGHGQNAYSILHLFAIIPPKSTYRAVNVVMSVTKWFELR